MDLKLPWTLVTQTGSRLRQLTACNDCRRREAAHQP